MKETCLHALTALLVVFAIGLLPLSAQNDATNRPPVQTFYLMEATPPYNTAEIKLNGGNARFFKIRVDNLANEVR